MKKRCALVLGILLVISLFSACSYEKTETHNFHNFPIKNVYVGMTADELQELYGEPFQSYEENGSLILEYRNILPDGLGITESIGETGSVFYFSINGPVKDFLYSIELITQASLETLENGLINYYGQPEKIVDREMLVFPERAYYWKGWAVQDMPTAERESIEKNWSAFYGADYSTLNNEAQLLAVSIVLPLEDEAESGYTRVYLNAGIQLFVDDSLDKQ